MAPCRRSDVRRGTCLCVEDRDLRVEDRDLLAEDRPVMAGNCELPRQSADAGARCTPLPCPSP
eukprot:6591213-Heterocapsa_arctica.AAC.1